MKYSSDVYDVHLFYGDNPFKEQGELIRKMYEEHGKLYGLLRYGVLVFFSFMGFSYSDYLECMNEYKECMKAE